MFTIVLTKLDFAGTDSVSVKILFFLPLILCLGGSIGMQSSSITLMTISNKDKEEKGIVLKECMIGVVTGILCSAITGLGTYMIISNQHIALLVSGAVFLNMVFGAFVGAFVPILLKKLDIDTSIVSSPIVAVTLDFIGICIFFLMATLFLS